MNKYKLRTKMLGIPVPGYGDNIWPEEEMRKYQIIENMLVAGLRGAMSCVFSEGDVTLSKGKDGKYFVSICATGAKPSITGTVGGAYFHGPSSVTWDGLDEGQVYFLYLKGTKDTFLEPSSVRQVSSKQRIEGPSLVLVAKADLRGDRPFVDRSPDGKMHARDLMQHVGDFENPHGEKMVQDGLCVRQTLSLEGDIEFGGQKMSAGQVAEALASIPRQEVVDCVSNGREGVVLTAKGRVVFAQACRTDSKGKLGEVYFGYYGKDAKVERPDQVIVKNDADKGVALRVLLICG